MALLADRFFFFFFFFFFFRKKSVSTFLTPFCCYAEDDIDIMPWRAGTFKALEIKAGRDFEETFIKDFLSALIKDHIFPFLQAIFHDRMNILPFQMEDVTSIIRPPFEWNRSIKGLVPPLD